MLSKIGPGQFRLILALLVVVEHLSRLQVGKVAVMVFFALSGYWVTKVYLERYSEKTSAVVAFYISRFLRIWPMYIFAIFMAFLVSRYTGSGVLNDSYWAVPILGIATHGVDLIHVSWSLDIELQFYFLLPFLLLFIDFSKGNGAWLKGLSLLIVITVLGWFLGRSYGLQTVLMFLPLFGAGAAIYLFDLQVTAKTAFWSLILFCVFAVAAFALPETRHFIVGGSGDVMSDKVFALIWALILCSFTAYNVRQNSGWLDRHLGNLSYTLYLLHFPLINLIRNIIDRDLEPLEKIAFLPILLFICILAYMVVDMRLEAMRRYVDRRVWSYLR